MLNLKKYFLEFLLKIKNIIKKSEKQSNTPKSFQAEYSKNVINDAAKLIISSKSDEIKIKVEKITLSIINKYWGDSDRTLDFLKSKKVKVFRLKNVSKFLKYINEKPGFILPQRGISAIFLNFIVYLFCAKKIVFKSKSSPMFVFSTNKVDEYYLASQIYKYIAYRKKMAGFEFEVQKTFKKLYKTPKQIEKQKLTAGEIYALKEAIARDVEATDFAFKLNEEKEKISKSSNS